MNAMDRDRPMPYALSNGSTSRNPADYDRTLEQFQFDTAPRYQPDAEGTYCATALEDGAPALGVILPKVYGANGCVGKPIGGTGSPFNYLQANDLTDWLASIDGSGNGGHGWKETSLAGAQSQAALGRPTILTYKNPDPTKHGHVAWMMSDGTLAQAGATCGYHIAIDQAFGNLVFRCWWHP
jgi:hypothetical protein